MKKITTIVAVILIAAMSVSLTGCYGSFSLTRKLYTWNGKVGDKYTNEAVFLALTIIPVYSVCTFIDAVFLNSIEFWTGKSPMALHEGMNKVNIKGKEVKVFLEKDNATIYDDNNNAVATVKYNAENKTWSTTIKGVTRKLMTVGENNVELYTPAGQTISVDKANFNSENTFLKFTECTAMN